MKHDHPQFKLRIPPNLKEALEQAAATSDRTLTAEIVARLESSFTPPSPTGLPPEFMAQIEALLDRKLGQVAVVDGAAGLSVGVLAQPGAKQARSKTKAEQ